MTTDRSEDARRKLVVLYRDTDLLVVDKPSGVVVHRGWGHDGPSLVAIVRRDLDARAAAPLHRLDRGTSGVVLFALHTDAARLLGGLFQRHEIEKHYVALVRGEAPARANVDHDIPRRIDGPRVPARTAVRRLAVAETEPRWVSLVEARPETGRLHQVRRHLKHINHPVIGDANYGKGPLNRALRDRYGLARLALHARMVGFIHPQTGEKLTFEAPLPLDLVEPYRRMGFADGIIDAPSIESVRSRA